MEVYRCNVFHFRCNFRSCMDREELVSSCLYMDSNSISVKFSMSLISL